MTILSQILLYVLAVKWFSVMQKINKSNAAKNAQPGTIQEHFAHTSSLYSDFSCCVNQ
jgi:hypothetical protein